MTLVQIRFDMSFHSRASTYPFEMGEPGRTAEHASKRYLMIFAPVALSAGSGLYFGNPIIFGIDKIAGCPANHYWDDTYLACCATKGYGDYEHGAFFFDMEPTAHDARPNAPRWCFWETAFRSLRFRQREPGRYSRRAASTIICSASLISKTSILPRRWCRGCRYIHGWPS